MTLMADAPPGVAPPGQAAQSGLGGSEAAGVGAGDWAGCADAGLVDAAVQAQVAENAARARRLAAIVEYHRREQAAGGRPGEPRPFRLTPRQATAAEFGPALVVTDFTVGIYLEIASGLISQFPEVWAMCLAGRLDLGRAQLWLEATGNFADPADVARFAASMAQFVARYDDPSHPLCTISRDRLQRAAQYRKRKYPQRSKEESFAEAFAQRRVSLFVGEDGMAGLGVRGMVTDALSADYRLTLIAKHLKSGNPAETRTLAQLRADVALDLLLGRIDVPASTGTLENPDPDPDPDPDADPVADPVADPAADPAADPPADAGLADAGPDGDAESNAAVDPAGLVRFHKVGAFARPVINVTVPIGTLMGLTDSPGVLSGGHRLPAELARIIALDPTSTWYRMLTDPARDCVELSTQAYEPSPPIVRETTARDQVCLWPGCPRPAVECECDHRTEYPAGETSTKNLGCLCKRHHKVKHARGFRLTKHADGSYTWTTRTGHAYRTRPPEQPVTEWPDPDSIAYLEALTTLL